MITAIVMACGFSKRFEGDKLLYEIDGMPLAEHVMMELAKSTVDERILVYRTNEIASIGAGYDMKCVLNEDAHLGQSMSIKSGINAADEASDAYMFLVADQVNVTSDVIDRLAKEHRNNPDMIIVPRFAGVQGNPVIFPSYLKVKLLSLMGDSGGKEVIRQETGKVLYVDFDDLGIFDIDTRDDLTRLL